MDFDPRALGEAAPLIIAHYRRCGRMLPWRESPTPYHVWISEIMLQQTRIEAAIPYYHRFLAALPTVAALAAAEEEELLKLWQGLGYYTRARNLKKAAEQVMAEFGGELPSDAALLRKLPGVGDYTAGAIASIAYGRPEPAVDGNVLRVVMRLTGCEADVLQPQTKKAVTEALRAVYPTGADAGALTQGIMELGETVCLPNGAPLCAVCPLADLCEAHRTGRAEQLPNRSEKKARRIENRTVFRLCCGETIALRKRPARGLLANLWELPNELGTLTEAEVRAKYPAAQSVEPLPEAKHIFTHVEWHMTGWQVVLPALPPEFTPATQAELRERYAVPNALRAYLPDRSDEGQS